MIVHPRRDFIQRLGSIYERVKFIAIILVGDCQLFQIKFITLGKKLRMILVIVINFSLGRLGDFGCHALQVCLCNNLRFGAFDGLHHIGSAINLVARCLSKDQLAVYQRL